VSGTSGCVIARDAAATLERCLASLAFCDECVVVVDPRSRDATQEHGGDAGQHERERDAAGEGPRVAEQAPPGAPVRRKARRGRHR